MRRVNHEKSKFIATALSLLILCIGIGYAALTENLNVDQAINYGSMKWDVGFIETADNGGTITSTSTISDDKKSISISCNIGMTSESQICITKATIKNSGTFNLMLDTNPTVTFDSTYVNSATISWLGSNKQVAEGDLLGANKEKELQITVVTNQLTKDLLLSSDSTIPIKLSFNWVETNLAEEPITYNIGQEITIGTEKFNVISEDTTTVTMLAQYNLGTDYRQNPLSAIEPGSYKHVDMKTPGGWGKPSEPTEIDINTYSIEAALYINTYVSFLNDYLGAITISGNLITLKELKKLGCNIVDTYKEERMDCLNSPYQNWLINEQNWVTRSADSTNTEDFFAVMSTGYIETSDVGGRGGARPVITISKQILENIDQFEQFELITFTVSGTQYQCEKGMTWEQWANSDYNINNFRVDTNTEYVYGNNSKIWDGSNPVSYYDIIEEKEYT